MAEKCLCGIKIGFIELWEENVPVEITGKKRALNGTVQFMR
jgi:hypothetical protein